jgi:hypothetical protein
MGIVKAWFTAATALWFLAGCASPERLNEDTSAIRLVPDDPVNPTRVQFEVPTAVLLGQPGPDRVPVTLKARIATRELAAHELAAHDYCPRGFTGPDGIHFPEGDRGRSAFVVRCRP